MYVLFYIYLINLSIEIHILNILREEDGKYLIPSVKGRSGISPPKHI